MLDRIAEAPGSTLDVESYLADFRAHFDTIEDVFWKLERHQTFQESDDPGYDAFRRGDWNEALRIENETRPSVRAHYDKIAKLGFEGRRLRVVESPVTPYLQWEMQALRIRAEAGERTHVLDAREARRFETRNRLPELVILGRTVLYEVVYDADGVHRGARRIEDREVIDRCRTELAELWSDAEPLATYFAREIAPLPPPSAQR